MVQQAWPENNKFQNSASAGQVYRFREEVVPGTSVVTYDSNSRTYHLGTVTGDYVYYPETIRTCSYEGCEVGESVPRDALSASTKNSLGAISTIFCLSEDAAKELTLWNQNGPALLKLDSPEEEVEAEAEIRRDTEERALGFLQDKLSKFDWVEIRHLLPASCGREETKRGSRQRVPIGERHTIASPDGFAFSTSTHHRRGQAPKGHNGGP